MPTGPVAQADPVSNPRSRESRPGVQQGPARIYRGSNRSLSLVRGSLAHLARLESIEIGSGTGTTSGGVSSDPGVGNNSSSPGMGLDSNFRSCSEGGLAPSAASDMIPVPSSITEAPTNSEEAPSGQSGTRTQRQKWMKILRSKQGCTAGPGGGGVPKVVLAASLPMSMPSLPGFRFWIDEVLWSQGCVAVELIEAVLMEAGGTRSGGPTRNELGRRHIDSDLGAAHCDSWEFLWTKSTYAIGAARNLRPGQVVSALVGLNVLTMKKKLQQTLKAAYGQAAFDHIMPVSFALPEELGEWQQQGLKLLATDEALAEGKGMKLLATDKALAEGKGLKLLATDEALAEGAKQAQNDASTSGRPHRMELKVAQQYLRRPLLLQGRKFHLRLWIAVTDYAPLTAFIHRRGLALCSSEKYEASSALALDGLISAGHVTNLARNEDGPVWSLQQFGAHLGSTAFQALWTRIHYSLGLTLAAAREAVTEAHHWLKPSIPNYGFQMIGADYLVDELMNPWLLEFNSSPSIMALHQDAVTQLMIREEKTRMLRNLPWLLEFNSSPSIMALHQDAVTQLMIREEKTCMLRDLVQLVIHRVQPPGAEPDHKVPLHLSPSKAKQLGASAGKGVGETSESGQGKEVQSAGEFEHVLIPASR
eukprot:gene3153-13167_t